MTVNSPSSLARFSLEWIRKIRLIELNVDHFTDLRIVTCNLLEVTLRCLAQMLLGGILPALHQTIKLDLL